MSKIQASAKMKIPSGMLEEYQATGSGIYQANKGEGHLELFNLIGSLVVIRQSVKSEKLMRVLNLL